MKTLPPGFAAHLTSGATTLAYCWRITRRDGGVLGFTEHDRDVICDGTTFAAATGFTASQMEASLGLSVDNFTAAGALSSASITEADILAGRYDDATVELLWVNWSDPTQFVKIDKGSLGEIKREGAAFTAEFRSLAHRLNQKIGGTFQRTCSAVLGDGKCGVNLATAAFTAAATIAAYDGARYLTCSGLSGFKASWFSDGVALFVAQSRKIDIKNHLLNPDGSALIELWTKPAFAVSAGNQLSLSAGCSKTLGACQTKFDNVRNFRGFPHIPGADAVTSYANRGDPANTGGSRFGN